MMIYVFQNVEKLTDNWHSGGGLVIVANGPEHARELIAGDKSIQLTTQDWFDCKVYPLNGHHNPAVFVFQDAGCC
jgi:protein-L-isoaspartate O-methyltransferase